MSTPSHIDPSTFPLRDLEQSMVKSSRLAAVCRLIDDAAEAELHTRWMNILLDEWARRHSPTGHASGAAEHRAAA